MPSLDLWLPILWLLLISSKPVSYWLGFETSMNNMEVYLEGSPIERNIYLLLLALGLISLFRRKIKWLNFISENRWTIFMFVYWLISIIWAEYAFVGFKRWVKDATNLVMVLIILTNREPIKAFRSVFSRYINILVPISVILIKYYAEIGRYYDKTTWEHLYSGVAIEKNGLGVITFISGMYLIWDMMEMRKSTERMTDFFDILNRFSLFLMVIWLLHMSKSMTSFMALVIGASILLILQLPIAKHLTKNLWLYSFFCLFIFLLIYYFQDSYEQFLKSLGRSSTLTGRTEIWTQVLSIPINSLIGTGYQNFWLGDRAHKIWSLWNFRANQAHNGYIETYLNGGWIGLFFLMMMIISSASKIKRFLLRLNIRKYDSLRFSILITTVFFNLTEGYFNNMSPIWFFYLMMTLSYNSYAPVNKT